ncbi:MAG: hypothetical protein J2P13_06220 [Acidobacteria bacterium]|nr:hypothetical protein [Acidobacteriota bacterium]
MASYSMPDPDVNPEIKADRKTWLQLYVDAMTEKDPYKRLAMVKELRKIPRHDDSEDFAQEAVVRPVKSVKKSKLVGRN